ncbi:MAG TPA: MoaD/ThiS family protein [Dehalococcoidales bacterium]
MSTKVHLYSNLQRYTQNQSVVEVEGASVGQCLGNLVARYPGLNKIIFDKNRNLLSNIYISVNLNSAQSEPLEKPIGENDQLYVILIVAGG